MQEKDCKLLTQLYSRLNIRPTVAKTNPILVPRPQSSLMAKSIANKIRTLKKNKLNETQSPSRKESAHAFTSFGIISLQTEGLGFGMPNKERGFVRQVQKENTGKFIKYESSCLFSLSHRTKKLSLSVRTECPATEDSFKCFPEEEKEEKSKTRPMRAKSAYYSRKSKFETFELIKHRKISENWNGRSFCEEQVRGWDTVELGEALELEKN